MLEIIWRHLNCYGIIFCDVNPPNPSWAAHWRATSDQGSYVRHLTDEEGYCGFLLWPQPLWVWWSGPVWWDDWQHPHKHRFATEHNSHKALCEFQTFCFWYQTVWKYLWVETHVVWDSSTEQQHSTEREWTETSAPDISEYRQAACDKTTFNFSSSLQNLGIQNIPPSCAQELNSWHCSSCRLLDSIGSVNQGLFFISCTSKRDKDKEIKEAGFFPHLPG